MQLGAFSVSLAVQDLQASREFYEKLGFSVFGGKPEHNFLMMRNGDHVLGLFHGMFEGNILTFNPGWDQNGEPLESFTDVRELAKQLSAKGVKVGRQTFDGDAGPGSFVAIDPDGNVILVDQHV